MKELDEDQKKYVVELIEEAVEKMGHEFKIKK